MADYPNDTKKISLEDLLLQEVDKISRENVEEIEKTVGKMVTLGILGLATFRAGLKIIGEGFTVNGTNSNGGTSEQSVSEERKTEDNKSDESQEDRSD